MISFIESETGCIFVPFRMLYWFSLNFEKMRTALVKTENEGSENGLTKAVLESRTGNSGLRVKSLAVVWMSLLICMLTVMMAGQAQASPTKSMQFKKQLILTSCQKVKLTVKDAEETVSWSTSDRKVATVSRNGIVRTKKAGRCRITARVNGKRYVCRLRVKPLALNKTELTLVRGRQVPLVLNNPDIAPAWKSSDERVASVSDEGIVQARAPGTCRISCCYKSSEVICSVKVTGITASALQKMYTADRANRKKILLAGSSSMDYWNSAPQAFAPYEIINMAISGTTVTQWLGWYKSMIVQYRPSAVVLYVGSNDLSNGSVISGETNASNTISLLKAIRQSLKKVPIFYVGISPCWARKGAWQDIAASNSLVRTFCGQETNMYYIDIAAACAARDGTPDPALFLSDRLHPNTAGYQIWKKVIAGQVKKLLRKMERSSKNSR